MDILFYLLIISSALFIVSRSRQEYIERLYKYKLYALRDKLRMMVIEDKVKSNNWVFDYLDSSICNTIRALDKINLWSAVAFHVLHKEDQSIVDFRTNLRKSVDKNEHLKVIYKNYENILFSYIARRSHLSIWGVSKLISSLRTARLVKKKLREYARNLRELPETSMSINYKRHRMTMS